MDTRLNEYNLNVNNEIDEQLKIAQNDYEKITKDAMKDVEEQISMIDKKVKKL